LNATSEVTTLKKDNPLDVICKRMTEKRRGDAQLLLDSFLRNDPHYLATSAAYGDQGFSALRRAIGLFLRRPELGFIWLAYLIEEPVAVCVISYAISTSIGGLVAKLDDLYVTTRRQQQGIATQLLKDLIEELKRKRVRRIDTAVYRDNLRGSYFYKKLGFKSLHEERMALVL
jgi:GNAT superfamily N-acetyltransferase